MFRCLTHKKGSETTEVEPAVFTTSWNREDGFKAYVNGKLVDNTRECGGDDGNMMRLASKLIKALRDSPFAPSCMIDRTMKAGPLDIFILEHRGLSQDVSPSMIVHCSRDHIFLPNKLYICLSQATKLTSRFSRSLVALIFDQPNAIRSAQDMQANHEKVEHLEKWFANLGADLDRKHLLVAITPSELEELNGDTVDALYSVRNQYRVPPPTRATSEAGDEDTANDQYLTSDSSEDQRFASKDLRRILAPNYGFNIVNSPTNDKSDTPANNISDYYNLPLVETQQRWSSNKVKIFADNDKAINYSSNGDVLDIPKDEELRLIDELSFEAPRSQYPGQALAIHLIYKGMLIDKVCTTLGGLEREFVFGNKSRWWFHNRVPEHSQLNDNTVKVLLKLAKAEPQFWEIEHDLNGVAIPQSIRDFHVREQHKEIKRMVKMCLENYFL